MFVFSVSVFFTHESSRVAATRERVCAREREREKCKEKLELPFIMGYRGGTAREGAIYK